LQSPQIQQQQRSFHQTRGINVTSNEATCTTTACIAQAKEKAKAKAAAFTATTTATFIQAAAAVPVADTFGNDAVDSTTNQTVAYASATSVSITVDSRSKDTSCTHMLHKDAAPPGQAR
jgi:hypothetical protein